MAIFSKIKSAISRAFAPKSTGITPTSSASRNTASAYNALSSIASKTNPASSGITVPAKTRAQQLLGTQGAATIQAKVLQGIPTQGLGAGGIATPVPSTGITNVNQYGGTTPVTISAGGRSSGITVGTPYNDTLKAGDKTATTTSVADIGLTEEQVRSNLALAGFDGGGSINSNVLASTSSPTAPSAPNYRDTGIVSTSGIDNDLLDYGYTKDATTGQLIKTQKTPEQLLEEERKKNMEDLLGFIPKKDSVYDDPMVQQQRELVRLRQQEINNATAQLNNVIAKQQQRLAQVRKTAMEEGVTETVYGNQERAINYDAMNEAAPLKAQIALAQGNLQLAQDFLSELRTERQARIDSDFAYNMAKFDSIKDFVKGEDKNKLDKLRTEEAFARQITLKNMDLQEELSKEAMKQGRTNLISQIQGINPASPNFSQQMSRIQTTLGTAVGGTGVTAEYGTPEYAQQIIASSAKYGDKRLVQDERKSITAAKRALGQIALYNELLSGKLASDTSKEVFGDGTGVIKGRLRTLAGQWGGDASAAAINATIQGIIPTVARGIFQEVGVLTDQDIANYKRTVPDINKPENANKLITLVLLRTLERTYADTLITAAQNQTNVSNFSKEYASVLKQINDLTGGGTQTTTTPKEGDTRSWEGSLYKVVGGQWVKQ